jgi:hypothetical protein
MLGQQRIDNYTAGLTAGNYRLTPAQRKRNQHKDHCRKNHAHFHDPRHPEKIMRCDRCRPEGRIADATQADPRSSRKWARS